MAPASSGLDRGFALIPGPSPREEKAADSYAHACVSRCRRSLLWPDVAGRGDLGVDGAVHVVEIPFDSLALDHHVGDAHRVLTAACRGDREHCQRDCLLKGSSHELVCRTGSTA